MGGLGGAADGTAVYVDQDPYAAGGQEPYYYADPYAQAETNPYGAPGAEDHFFNASDEELEQWSKGLAKQDRKRRNVGLKILVTIILIVLVAFGAAVFLYTQGWGYPSQDQVVEQLFSDPKAAFASEVTEENAASMTELLSTVGSPAIDGMDKSMSDSTVYVTAKTPEGGDVQYKVSLVRNMIGWKVSNVELYFPSQN